MYPVPAIDLQSFFDHAEALNIVPIPRAFQPGGETFDDRFQFVGPSLRPREQATDGPLARLKQQPTLYIALGTVCQEEAAFYQTCFAAFGEGNRVSTRQRAFWGPGEQAKPPWQVVLATGKSNLSILGASPCAPARGAPTQPRVCDPWWHEQRHGGLVLWRSAGGHPAHARTEHHRAASGRAWTRGRPGEDRRDS